MKIPGRSNRNYLARGWLYWFVIVVSLLGCKTSCADEVSQLFELKVVCGADGGYDVFFYH